MKLKQLIDYYKYKCNTVLPNFIGVQKTRKSMEDDYEESKWEKVEETIDKLKCDMRKMKTKRK